MDHVIPAAAACVFSVLQVLAARKNFYAREYGFLAENLILCAVVDLLFLYNGGFPYPLSPVILVCVAATVVGDTYLGKKRDLYHTTITYDRLLHLFGSFSFALFAFGILKNLFGPVSPGYYLPVIVVAEGISLGVLFEIYEFVLDSLPKKSRSVRRQHGLTDTDFDLLADTVGSLLAGIAARFLFL